MGDKPRAHRGRFVRTVDTAERDAEAAELRSTGATFQAIADALGYSHRDLARRAVERGLTAIVRPAAETVRTLELEKLDRLEERAWLVLRREHVVAQNGRVVTGADGRPLADDAPVLNAIDRLLKIQERRARLLGLDAPTRAHVAVETNADHQAEIANLFGWLVREHGNDPVPPWHPEATREVRGSDT